jgi:hypothetical protein
MNEGKAHNGMLTAYTSGHTKEHIPKVSRAKCWLCAHGFSATMHFRADPHNPFETMSADVLAQT